MSTEATETRRPVSRGSDEMEATFEVESFRVDIERAIDQAMIQVQHWLAETESDVSMPDTTRSLRQLARLLRQAHNSASGQASEIQALEEKFSELLPNDDSRAGEAPKLDARTREPSAASSRTERPSKTRLKTSKRRVV